MAKPRLKNRYTPLELAKRLKISTKRLNELVSDGQLPKGRIGEDGRRYYTQQDLDFILREWKTQTTGRFLMYTLPLIMIVVVLVVLTTIEIKNKIEVSKVEPTPTIPSGYGAPPPFLYQEDAEWPVETEAEIPSPLYQSIEDYRRQMQEEKSKREHQRSTSHLEGMPSYTED
ncbi:MAG: helix-turn-helix domain-containing protein [bacterium]